MVSGCSEINLVTAGWIVDIGGLSLGHFGQVPRVLEVLAIDLGPSPIEARNTEVPSISKDPPLMIKSGTGCC